MEVRNPSDLEKQSTIQRFEFTHELAWKVMKDYLEYEGISGITGSRSATREAFNKGRITNGQAWMDMIESRNKTVPTYLSEILESEYSSITMRYFPLLLAFEAKMKDFPEIERVVIYGSRAKGAYREGSDIDITLVGANVTEEIRSKVWLELDDLNTPY
jgi:nucleotidyltransferase substrate binding protein (TIGR01987 family)